MNASNYFNVLARVLHWTMAAAILAMLFIGVAMVASLGQREWLIALHRPLGFAILLLALLRLGNRLRHAPPPLPAGVPGRYPSSHEAGYLFRLLRLGGRFVYDSAFH